MRLEIDTAAGPAWADLDHPRSAPTLLMLTHGAGGGVGSADVLAVRDAAIAANFAVALITQPYRVAGRRAPPAPRPQDEAWLTVLAALRRRRGLGTMPLIVGGRSNGARVACRTALAAGASAVVALAFPLHPPARATPSHAGGSSFARPDRSRLDELAGSGVPTLVVQGDRDPFGRPDPGPGREVVVITGADHTLKRDPAAVASAVVRFLSALDLAAAD